MAVSKLDDVARGETGLFVSAGVQVNVQRPSSGELTRVRASATVVARLAATADVRKSAPTERVIASPFRSGGTARCRAAPRFACAGSARSTASSTGYARSGRRRVERLSRAPLARSTLPSGTRSGRRRGSRRPTRVSWVTRPISGSTASRPAARRTCCSLRERRSNARRFMTIVHVFGQSVTFLSSLAHMSRDPSALTVNGSISVPSKRGEIARDIAGGTRSQRTEGQRGDAARPDRDPCSTVVADPDETSVDAERPAQPSGQQRHSDDAGLSHLRQRAGRERRLKRARSSARLSTRNGAVSAWKLSTPSVSDALAPRIPNCAFPARTSETMPRS